MSDPVIIALITALPTTLTALSLFKLRRLHHEMNSMKDALVDSARIEGHAVGKAEGVAQQKAETDVKMSQ